MNEEERREMLQRNYADQLSSLGFGPDGMGLSEQSNPAPGWISVKDRMPAETHSLFWPWRDSSRWSKAMWKEQSDKVIVSIQFKDGTRIVRTGATHDGKWRTDVSATLEPVVTHWMPLPEPPEEG